MNFNPFLKKILPHSLALLVFLVLALVYMSPVMQGKVLKQHDVTQHLGASHQSINYKNEAKEHPFWNPYMFSGMPNYMIFMDYPSSISVHLGRLLVYTLPEPANIMFLYMIGAYLGLLLMGFNPWIAALGAVSYAFSAYNVINIGAGHISKTISVATIPPILGAVWYTYNKNVFIGAVMLAFFSAIHQYANFVQMTYYLGLTLGIFALVQLFIAFKNKEVKKFWIASAFAIMAGILSLSNHINRYLVLNEYTQETMRGRNELSDTPNNILSGKKQKNKQNKDGLDKAYAFNWSYGIGETLNLLIANSYGGSSFEAPKEDSKLLATLEDEAGKYNMSSEQLLNALYAQGLIPSLYWGEQPGTGGPAYMGIVLFSLFVLGMFVSKNPLKWWVLGSVILCVSIAWGKNFFLNDMLFDYFPLFNKFRAVTMILSFTPIFMIIGAALGIQEFWQMHIEQKKLFFNKNKWFFAAYIGVFVLLALFGSFLLDFQSSQDKNISKAIASQSPELAKVLLKGIKADRIAMFQNDIWRGIGFLVFALLALLAFLKNFIKIEILMAILVLASLVDLWGVDKRYLNNDKFVDKEEASQIEANEANEQILKDKTYFRVLDLGNPFNDAANSYFHYSAGGYHAAKMRRYQDIIEGYLQIEIDSLYKDLQKNGGNLAKGASYKPVMDMLNIKYFIVPLKNNHHLTIQNPDALGAAWFVEKFTIAQNPDDEFRFLKNHAPKNEAILRKETNMKDLEGITYNSAATIKLLEHTPNKMTYESNSSTQQLAVFSEVFYQKGDSGWQVYVDGKKVTHFRANYLLRALPIPAGKHNIEFRFEPTTFKNGEQLALVSSILMLLTGLGAVVWLWKQRKSVNNAK
ncbi:MAG: YfhO family protein [Thermonemataceae bacterium]|nr:YfhO family protein [Thermonemataceae bacterium]